MAIILESIGDSMDKEVYSPREKEMIFKLRTMLKDVPQEVVHTLNTLVEEQRGERWTDMQLLIYLQQAIADINCEPAQTSYDLDNFPKPWEACIINGAMIFSLVSEGILQNGKIRLILLIKKIYLLLKFYI